MARAHQLAMEGYKYMFNEKLVTVWSAPNYTYRCGNLASIMELDENLQKYFKIFEAAPTEGKASDGKSVPLYFLWVWWWSNILLFNNIYMSKKVDQYHFINYEFCFNRYLFLWNLTVLMSLKLTMSFLFIFPNGTMSLK